MSEEKKYASDESRSAPDWFLKCIEPAKASAAPEQEQPLTGKRLYQMWCRESGLANDPWSVVTFEHQGWNGLAKLLTHADPSEVERLRAELAEARRNEHNSEVAYRAAIEKQDEIRADRDAATRRADAAERKLASVTEYVQGMVSAAGSQPSVATGYLRDILDALLSANAEPAKPSASEARMQYGEEYGFPASMRQIHPVQGDPYWSYDQGVTRFASAAKAIDAEIAKGGDGEAV